MTPEEKSEYHRLYQIEHRDRISARKRAKYLAEPEKRPQRNAANRAYCAANAEKVRAQQNAKNARKRALDPELVRSQRRAQYLKHKERELAGQRRRNTENPDRRRDIILRSEFGITLAQREAMIAAQNGGCKLCFKPLQRGKETHTDHKHGSRTVRGILCAICNTRLGVLEKSTPEWLARAYDYLQTDGKIT